MLTYDELNASQKGHLAACHLLRLADEGVFEEVTGLGRDKPSDDDIENAIDIVPEDVLEGEYSSRTFEEDDF